MEKPWVVVSLTSGFVDLGRALVIVLKELLLVRAVRRFMSFIFLLCCSIVHAGHSQCFNLGCFEARSVIFGSFSCSRADCHQLQLSLLRISNYLIIPWLFSLF